MKANEIRLLKEGTMLVDINTGKEWKVNFIDMTYSYVRINIENSGKTRWITTAPKASGTKSIARYEINK